MRTLSAPLAPNEARRRKTPEALARLHSRARYSLALLTAEAGARSRPLQGTLTPRIFGNRESDQRRESVKSFANALIDALQRIADALERIAERMK